MSRKNTSAKKSGAELRQLRDQRATEGPYAAQEASRRERSFLSRLTGAKEDFDWILSNEAWVLLGHENFTSWYVARVQPVIEALGAQPAPELANEVLARIRDDEAALPPSQRRTKAELAAITGIGEWKQRGRQDQRNRRSTQFSDLDSEASAGPGVPADQNGDAVPPTTSVTASQPDPVSGGAGSGTQTSGDEVQELAPREDPPASGELAGDEAAEDPSVEPPLEGSSAADPQTAAGQPQAPDVPEVPPRSGQLSAGTPSTVAGVSERPDADREQSGEDQTAESSPDQAEDPFTEWVHDLLDVIGKRPDAEDGTELDVDMYDAFCNAVADLEGFLADVRGFRGAA